MKAKSMSRVGLLLGGVAAAGLLAGSLAAGAIATGPPLAAGRPTEKVGSATYPVNDKGQTFGSAMSAQSPSEEPELIEVIANSGKKGYAYKSALDEGSSFKTPEEALAWQKSKGNRPTVIPVYESDGVTRIGTFTHFPGSDTGAGPK